MPYNLRSGKQSHSPQEIDTALIMLKMSKDAADQKIKGHAFPDKIEGIVPEFVGQANRNQQAELHHEQGGQ